MFGSEIMARGTSNYDTMASSIVLLWVSAISFANGWDAVSDFSKWIRRMKCNSLVSADIVKLHDLLK